MLNKKILAITAACLIPLQFAGCGGTKINNSDVTIHWYMPKPIDNIKDQENVEGFANKTFKEKVGASLKFHFIDRAAWEEKMNVMVASGEEYDLVNTSSTTNKFNVNVQRGAFADIKEYLSQYGPDIMAKVDPKAWPSVTLGGQILAVPGQNPYAIPAVMVFKKEFTDKYKFDFKNVKSLADLEPYLETIKKNEPGITPLLSIATNSVSNAPVNKYIDITTGVVYDEEKGKMVFIMDCPETLNSYKLSAKYYQKGYIAKDAATKQDYLAEAKSGKYAVLPDTGAYSEDGSKSSGVYGYPCGETLLGYLPVTTQSMMACMTAVSSTSKHPDKAVELLNLIWKDRFLSNTLAYGIEGVNYEVKSGKGTDNISVIPKSGKEQTWGIWHNWLGPLWEQWDSPWNSTESLVQMQKNNETAKVSDILGFMLDVEPIKNEIAQISAVNKESSSVFATGSAPDVEQYIETIRQKYKEAGIEKVLAEAQAQLDNWKKNK